MSRPPAATTTDTKKWQATQRNAFRQTPVSETSCQSTRDGPLCELTKLNYGPIRKKNTRARRKKATRKGMAVSRRGRSKEGTLEPPVRERKKRRSVTPEPPKKRRRRHSFTFDSEESDVPYVAPQKQKANVTNGMPESRRKGSKNTVDGAASSCSVVKGKSTQTRERSPSPAFSEASDDSIARVSVTPTKRSIQTPTKTNSLKENNAIVNGTSKPAAHVSTKSFQERLKSVKDTSKDHHSALKKSQSVGHADSAAVSNTRTKQSAKGKPPTARELNSIKSQVIAKLCGRSPIPLIGHPAKVVDEIHSVMTRTLLGESNSLLLLGAPGSAKSTIIATALNRLKNDYPHEGAFYTIRLNGHIQTDDKIALKEIARQLALEMNVEMEKMSFADTLTSFLYTLSHPSELAETDGSTTSTSLIFILDSFDEFLLHPRQALLYNLFDIAQSRKAPIAVICLGRQVNAIDGLEKRVKSRFSGRIEHVGRPRNEDEFWRVCEATLTVDDGPGFVREWNCHIKDLADHAVMKDLVHEIFVESRDVREFFNRSIPVISALRHNGEFLPSAESWSKQFLLPPDSKLSLIEGLSQLELSLLISATRLETFYALETFNFNMVYETYTTLVSRSRTHLSSVTALGVATVLPGGAVQLWGRDIAARAWEKLGEIGLWTVVSGKGEGRGRFMRCEVGMVELVGICERAKLLNSAMRGWFKEVV